MTAVSLTLNTPAAVHGNADPYSGSVAIGDCSRIIDRVADDYSKMLREVSMLKKECELAAQMKNAMNIKQRDERYKAMGRLSVSLCLRSYDRAFGEIKTGLRIAQGVIAGTFATALCACIPTFLTQANPVMTALGISGGLYLVYKLVLKGMIPHFFEDFIIPPRLDRALSDEVQTFSLYHEKELESALTRLREIESSAPDVGNTCQNEVIMEDSDFVSIDGIRLKKKGCLFQIAFGSMTNVTSSAQDESAVNILKTGFNTVP